MQFYFCLSVLRERETCNFCSTTFSTNAEKNMHILDHFEQEFCTKCDQNLLRIGENLYVLHGTITCIETNVKDEPIEMKMDENVCSLYNQEMVDVKHPEPDYFEHNDEQFVCSLENPHINDMFHEIHAQTYENRTLNEIKHEQNEDLVFEGINSFAIENSITTKRESRQNMNNKKQYNARFECDKCEKILPLLQLQSHMKQHGTTSDKIKITCDECGSTNLSKWSYKRHHQTPGFKCSECNNAYCKVSQLKGHYHEQHPGIDPYKGIDIKSKCTIREMYDSKSMKKYKCTFDGCNKMLSSVTQQFHIDSEHGGIKYDCDICKKSFTALSYIRAHMETHHTNRQRYSCSVCGVSNITKHTLKRHHSKQNVVCPLCEKRFCQKIELKKHHFDVHCDGIKPPRKSELEKKVKKFKCIVDGCNAMLSTNNRRYHMAAKHKGKTYECDICKKTFTAKSVVCAHILRIHASSTHKKFKCELCGKKFLSKGILEWHHKISHIKARNFMCSECGATFVQKSQLLVHITKHTGEKPYPCRFDGCTKRFRTQTRRMEHSRSHTGEKPYECPVDGCVRRFAYWIDVKRHKFNAHGIYTKKFPCQICTAIFPENMLLKKHMKKHEIQTQ